MADETFPWGCSCGRLCAPEDDECESCDGARESGVVLRTSSDRARFLRRAEKRDRRALEGVAFELERAETSYRDAEREFERSIGNRAVMTKDKAGYAFFGELAEDPLEAFYRSESEAFYRSESEPWMWG